MKYPIIFSVLLFLNSLHAIAQVAERDRRGLGSIYMPLLDGQAGGIRIAHVPVFLHGSKLNGFINAMMAPTFAASADDGGRSIDINLVTRSRIILRLEQLSEDREFKLVFDLSNAELPEGVQVSLVDIVEATLTCFRLQHPREYLTQMKIEYIGILDSSKVKGLGTRLWPGMP